MGSRIVPRATRGSGNALQSAQPSPFLLPNRGLLWFCLNPNASMFKSPLFPEEEWNVLLTLVRAFVVVVVVFHLKLFKNKFKRSVWSKQLASGAYYTDSVCSNRKKLWNKNKIKFLQFTVLQKLYFSCIYGAGHPYKKRHN